MNMMIKNRIFHILGFASLLGLAACDPSQTQMGSQPAATNFVGTFSDNCAAPTTSFAFEPGGKGRITSRGGNYNFTWSQKGRSAFVYVATADTGKPAQTYTLNRTERGVYLAAISTNGQLQDLTKMPAQARTKSKCK